MINRALAFAGIAIFCIILSISYARFSVARSRSAVADRTLPAIDLSSVSATAPPARETEPIQDGMVPSADIPPAAGVPEAAASADGDVPEPGPVEARVRAPVMLVRHTGLDRSYGVMAVETGHSAGDARQATELRCDRIHFAVDRGVCLTTDRLYTTQSLIIFDETFTERYRLHLSGLPSRARVSANGRLAASTVFVTGHSYSDGAFSTETSIVDTYTGDRVIANLQTLPISLSGQPVAAIDVNVWGVTFMPDGDGFYATVATGGHTYLVQGSANGGRMRVLRDGVECPSVSPDGRRIAFKKRLPGSSGEWRIHVMDAVALVEWPVAEARSVDDQVEWLDEDTLVYVLPREGAPLAVTDLWSVAADGSGRPRLVASDASSPAVVRAGRWAAASVAE